MKIATSLNLRPAHLTEAELIQKMAAVGFDGADFNFCDLIRRLDWRHEAEADAYVDGLGTAAANAGIAWVQSHGPMFNMFGSTDWDVNGRELCPLAIRACGRLGLPWMVLHPETLVGSGGDSTHYAETLRQNAGFFRSLLPVCEKYGVGIAIENMPEPMAARGGARSFGGTPTELIDLIDALDHPLIGACWDTGHAKINRLDQRAGITALGSRLKVLHVQENDGKGDDHMLPFFNGEQGVDWPSVAAGLSAIGYTGAFTYEAHNSFRALPPELFDDMLQLSVKIARHITSGIQ